MKKSISESELKNIIETVISESEDGKETDLPEVELPNPAFVFAQITKEKMGVRIWKQPYFTPQTDVVGKKGVYSKDDILKLGLSATNQKKLDKLKQGGKLPLGSFSRGSYWGVYQLTHGDRVSLKKAIELHNKVKELKQEILDKTQSLQDELKKAETEIIKLNRSNRIAAAGLVNNFTSK